MQRHELKTWPRYFAAVRSGQKRFEIRRNDRDFAVGDMLVLQEFDPDADAYTGQVEERQITFILSEEDLGVIHGFVAIGFGPMAATPVFEDALITLGEVAMWHQHEGEQAMLRSENDRRAAEAFMVAELPHNAARYKKTSEAGAGIASFHLIAASLIRRQVVGPDGDVDLVQTASEVAPCA